MSISVACTACGHGETGIRDSRTFDGGETCSRRRVCAKCSHRFTTVEVPKEVIDALRRLPKIGPKMRAYLRDALAVLETVP
jgi:transcriptional regulator NrdR family protein